MPMARRMIAAAAICAAAETGAFIVPGARSHPCRAEGPLLTAARSSSTAQLTNGTPRAIALLRATESSLTASEVDQTEREDLRNLAIVAHV
ncbi:unnamed protein product, partial [Hapterophycus canaliculatus]